MSRILKEDIGFTSDETQVKIGHNAKSGEGKASGNKKKMPENRILIRPPKKEEIQAADVNPSDYQIAQLRILSKILFDFGLISNVYRSKKTTTQADTRKTVEKYTKIFNLFCNTFNENEPIKNVRATLDLLDNEDLVASELTSVLNNINSLNVSEDELLSVLASTYKHINNYDDSYEPSEQDLNVVRGIYEKLNNVLLTAQNNQHTLKDVKKRFQLANTVNSYMKTDIMQGANNIVYNDTTVKTVSDLQSDITEYLKGQSREGKSIHSNTALHQEASKNMRSLALAIKRDGFEGGLTVGNMFEYMKANEPDTIQWISNQYDLPVEDMNSENFPTWESLAKFFYSPENIERIENQQLGTKNRSRAKGDERKGAAIAVDMKTVQKRIKSLKTKINKGQSGATTSSSRIEELEKRLAEKEEAHELAKNVRSKIKADLEEVKQTEDSETIKELEQSYKAADDMVKEISRNASAIRHALKKAKQNPDNTIKLSDKEKLEQLQKEEEAIVKKAFNVIDDDTSNMEALREIENAKRMEAILDDIDYYSTSFVVNTTKQEIIDYIIDNLKLVLDKLAKYKVDDKEAYYNIDAYDPGYEDMLVKGTEIAMDYPRKTFIYKSFKANKNEAFKLINSVLAAAKNKFRVNVNYIHDEEFIAINKKLSWN